MILILFLKINTGTTNTFHGLERQEQFLRLGLFGGLILNSQLSVGNLKIVNYCNGARTPWLLLIDRTSKCGGA